MDPFLIYRNGQLLNNSDLPIFDLSFLDLPAEEIDQVVIKEAKHTLAEMVNHDAYSHAIGIISWLDNHANSEPTEPRNVTTPAQPASSSTNVTTLHTGRGPGRPRGGQRMFNDDQVRMIRRSQLSADQLAEQFGCSRSTIDNIKQGRAYTDVS